MADHNWDFGLRSLQVKLQGLESVVYLFLPFDKVEFDIRTLAGFPIINSTSRHLRKVPVVFLVFLRPYRV